MLTQVIDWDKNQKIQSNHRLFKISVFVGVGFTMVTLHMANENWNFHFQQAMAPNHP